MFKTKTCFFIVIALIAAIAIFILDFKRDIQCDDILVELNGLVFDLVIFGILITAYEAITLKKEKIAKYKEEIYDYRFLENEVASFRLIGTIKRLLDLGVKEIDLSFSYIVRTFESPSEMRKWKFEFSKLSNCKFVLKEFEDCNFYSTEFRNVTFYNVRISNCNFQYALFENCTFSKCIFSNEINFNYAYIDNKEWVTTLKENNNQINAIIDRYVVSENTVTYNNKEFYQLIDKSLQTTIAEKKGTLQDREMIEFQSKMFLHAYSTIDRFKHNQDK